MTLAVHGADAPAPAVTPAAAPSAPVDDATASHQGYPSDRYEQLWTKSPFAVETPDEVSPTESAEYSLVGIAELDGVTYASLVVKQNGNHILVSSKEPLNGLALNSVTKKPDGATTATYATFTNNGATLTLKLETTPTGGAPGMPPNANPMAGGNMGMPGTMTPNAQPVAAQQNNFAMPGAGGGGREQGSVRPMIRIRRPVIHVPPRVENTPPAGQPPPPPTTPAPAPAH